MELTLNNDNDADDEHKPLQPFSLTRFYFENPILPFMANKDDCL